MKRKEASNVLSMQAQVVVAVAKHGTIRSDTQAVINLIEEIKGSQDGWWARGDSNPGPPPCKGGVLTGLDDGPETIFPHRYLSFDC